MVDPGPIHNLTFSAGGQMHPVDKTVRDSSWWIRGRGCQGAPEPATQPLTISPPPHRCPLGQAWEGIQGLRSGFPGLQVGPNQASETAQSGAKSDEHIHPDARPVQQDAVGSTDDLHCWDRSPAQRRARSHRSSTDGGDAQSNTGEEGMPNRRTGVFHPRDTPTGTPSSHLAGWGGLSLRVPDGGTLPSDPA